MPKEIERKFLVASDAWRAGRTISTPYRQGYLAETSTCVARVRVAGTRGYLTVKGAARGIARDEYEYPIPLSDAEAMLEFCPEIIEKTRHLVSHAGLVWEVDVFSGDCAGLVVAEIELVTEDQLPTLPPWVGREVTALARYSNASLARRPYSTWSDAERSGV